MPIAKADSQVTVVEAIESLVGDDSTLLVDLLAYRVAYMRALLPGMGSVGCAVIISTRAVSVDPDGRHINGDDPPRFPTPMNEGMPTVPPAADDVDPFSCEGYVPSKVAAERVALDSGPASCEEHRCPPRQSRRSRQRRNPTGRHQRPRAGAAP